jgi:hypothetical protein
MPSESAIFDTPYDTTLEDWLAVGQHDLAETRRRRIVNLIFLVYWLLIFEGALRKWVLPSYQREIYFIRDPFVLVIYWLSARYRFFKRATIPLTIMTVLAWACVMEIVYHMVADQSDLLLTAVGLRSYFFYVPLAAIIAETFDRADLQRLVRQTLLVAVPVAVISIIQSHSPPSAVINAGIASDAVNQVSALPVGEGFLRTTGTFTSNMGQELFVGSIVAMLLWVWTLPADSRPLQGAMLLAVTAATLTNVVVSGQRSVFVMAGLILLAAFVAAVLMNGVGNAWNVLKSCALLAVLGLALGPTLFRAQLHALAERSAGAAEGDDAYSYGIVNRALHDFVNFEDYIGTTPLVGDGIGQTSNAGAILQRTTVGWSENEWQRHVQELGPFLGIVLILLRVALVITMCGGACVAARRHEDALGLLLFGFIGVVVLYFPVTSQGTATGYAWIFAGFCMAANRHRDIEWDL